MGPTDGGRGSAIRTDVVRQGARILWMGIREQPRIFTISAIGSFVFSIVSIASAFVLGQIAGRVIVPAFDTGDIAVGSLVLAASVILGISVLKICGVLARRLAGGLLQFRLQASYRRRVTKRYLELPLSWHNRNPTGSLLSNANADVESLWYPVQPLPMALGAVCMAVVSGAALFATDWVLALVGLAIFPAVFAINVAYSRHMSPRMARAQQLRADVSSLAHESFDGALVIKTMGREAAETQRFAAKAGELRDALIRVGRVRGLFDPFVESLPSLGTLAVLVIGTARLQAGMISVADLVSIAFLFSILSLPLRAIGWVLGDMPRSVVGWKRVRNVLTATGSMRYGDGTLPASSRAAELELRGVSYQFPPPEGTDEAVDVLHGVDLSIRAGHTVALVGPTGAGKSTLTMLISRLVDPDSGRITLDGTDLTSLSAGEVSASVALVPQTTFVFDDTVRGNITLGEDLDDERIWAALRLAQAERFVKALPDDLDTMVGERGASLSGGQRQRLALARALVRKPRLLVLDDATSSVDPSVEAAILRGLREADLAATVLVIAYRRATIALADEVVYLEQGSIVARGSHAELVRDVPGYARMVRAYSDADRDAELDSDLDSDAVSA